MRNTVDRNIKEAKTREFYAMLQKRSQQAEEHPETLVPLDVRGLLKNNSLKPNVG